MHWQYYLGVDTIHLAKIDNITRVFTLELVLVYPQDHKYILSHFELIDPALKFYLKVIQHHNHNNIHRETEEFLSYILHNDTMFAGKNLMLYRYV